MSLFLCLYNCFLGNAFLLILLLKHLSEVHIVPVFRVLGWIKGSVNNLLRLRFLLFDWLASRRARCRRCFLFHFLRFVCNFSGCTRSLSLLWRIDFGWGG